MAKLTITLIDDEIICLQLAVLQASKTTFMVPETRKAMQEFARQVVYAVSVQCSDYKLDGEYGDF